MALQTRSWRHHLPIVSLAPRRTRRVGILRRCVGVLADAVARWSRAKPATRARRQQEPPPIRWVL